MPSFLVCLEVHPLPESPPEGERRTIMVYGHSVKSREADSLWVERQPDQYVAWSELPVLPAPGDRLTTEHVELVLGEARQRDGVPHSYWVKVSDAAARLRHAIEAIDSGKHVTPHDYQNGVNP